MFIFVGLISRPLLKVPRMIAWNNCCSLGSPETVVRWDKEKHFKKFASVRSTSSGKKISRSDYWRQGTIRNVPFSQYANDIREWSTKCLVAITRLMMSWTMNNVSCYSHQINGFRQRTASFLFIQNSTAPAIITLYARVVRVAVSLLWAKRYTERWLAVYELQCTVIKSRSCEIHVRNISCNGSFKTSQCSKYKS